MRQLSLRTRLILGVILLAGLGLLAADFATYRELRSFLIGQTDQQLDDAHRAVEFDLHGPRGPGFEPGEGGAPSVRGYAVQIRQNGTVRSSSPARDFPGGPGVVPDWPSDVSLPSDPEQGSGDRVRYLTVKAAQGGGRLRLRVWSDNEAPNVLFLLGAPLKSVDNTLHRLLGIELLVTLIVLGALAALGLWLVRLSLRPLDAIAATAAKIAGGDLTQRIERDDERTEVGRLGRSLNAMLAQIEAGYRAREASERKLRRFVADASHELRTPLAAVRAYAELFGRGAAQNPADLERSMTGIGRESERMSLLVDDLLLLARLDEGRPLESQPGQLDDLVHEAVDAARAVDPERPLECTLESAVVEGDRDRIRQVVDNLLANVRAHTPPGTPAHVNVTCNGRYAILDVADEGPGLEPE